VVPPSVETFTEDIDFSPPQAAPRMATVGLSHKLTSAFSLGWEMIDFNRREVNGKVALVVTA
jgi:hypothetical protein